MVHIAPVKQIVEIKGGAVNNLLRDILRFANEKAERLERPARLKFDLLVLRSYGCSGLP